MLKESEWVLAFSETGEYLKRNLPVVIKLGGSTLESQDETLRSVAELYRHGISVILVHGGGNDIDKALRQQGIEPTKVNGKRVTDERTLAIVQQETARINRELTLRLNNHYGIPAASFIAAGILTQRDQTLGFVGKNPVVKKSLFQASLDVGQVPVVAPITTQIDNVYQDLNTNADEVASAIAQELRSLLVMVTDVPGVIKNGRVIRQFHSEDMIAVTGGMIPKVQACVDVANVGGKAIICQPDDILENVLATKQQGTYFGKR